MKTKSNKQSKKQNPGLSFRPELSSQSTAAAATTATSIAPAMAQPEAAPAPEKPARVLPYVNYEEREKSRSLPSAEVLEHLRRWYPQAYELAEVVGAWVWVTFREQPAENVRAGLSQIGFHWNNARKCWQHPCGHFAAEGSGADPRKKYGSHFAADLKAA